MSYHHVGPYQRPGPAKIRPSKFAKDAAKSPSVSANDLSDELKRNPSVQPGPTWTPDMEALTDKVRKSWMAGKAPYSAVEAARKFMGATTDPDLIDIHWCDSPAACSTCHVRLPRPEANKGMLNGEYRWIDANTALAIFAKREELIRAACQKEIPKVGYEDIGKIAKREGAINGDPAQARYVWMWMYDLFTKNGKGQKIGQVNRHVPLVLVKVDMLMLFSVEKYRKKIYLRTDMDENKGMSVGGMRIIYSGGSRDVDRVMEGRHDRRGHSGGYGPDSDAKADEGNFAENFNEGSSGGELEQSYDKAEKTEDRTEQLYERTQESKLAKALEKNPDLDLDEWLEKFDEKFYSKLEVDEETGTVSINSKETEDRELDAEAEAIDDPTLADMLEGGRE